MSLARPRTQVRGSGQRDCMKPDRKRPPKNSIRSRPGFEPLRRTGPSPSCLPVSHQRLPRAFISSFAARGGERPLFVGAPQARFIQRQLMMRTIRFSVNKMQACVGSWLTSPSPDRSAVPAFLNSGFRPIVLKNSNFRVDHNWRGQQDALRNFA
jgi:hypothetical protein